jgi:hypothetical protein
MGECCIGPHFLDLSKSWRRMVSFTLRPLYPRGKRPRYPFDMRLGGPQSWSGWCGEEKILDPTGTRTDHLVVQPTASCYTDYAIPGSSLAHVRIRNAVAYNMTEFCFYQLISHSRVWEMSSDNLIISLFHLCHAEKGKHCKEVLSQSFN